MRALTVVAVGLSFVGCKKEPAGSNKQSLSPTTPASTAEQDALWALAPAGTEVGIVATARGLALLEGGATEARKVSALFPELVPMLAEVDAEWQKQTGTTTMSASGLGLTTEKGGAIFKAGKGTVVIIPLGDRDQFLKVSKITKGTDSDTTDEGGVCKTIHGVYACAKPAALLDTLGKNTLPASLKLVGARGEIEIAGVFPLAVPIPFGIVAQLDRGALSLRVAVNGISKVAPMRTIAGAKPRVVPDHTTAFAVLDLGSLLPSVPAAPLIPGLNADELARTIAGPLTMSIEPGPINVDVRVPLSDTVAAQKLVDGCTALPPLAMLGATAANGICHVAVPQIQTELDMWVEGKELRIGRKGATPTTARAPLSGAGAELANTAWAVAFYGRGTLLAAPQMPAVPPAQLPPQAQAAIRLFMLINELGMAMRMEGDTLHVFMTVRTAWANPDDVTQKILAVPPDDVLAGKGAAAGKAIADAAKSSPFAADYVAGWSGLMIPSAAIGMMAAVAIPAFMQYMKRSKQSEAAMQLDRLKRRIEQAHGNGGMPIGTTATTTSCCDQPGGKCSDPATWQDPIWQKLDFAIEDPHLYRYEYSSSDGKSFIVRAVGDLDCDGTEVTHALVGTATADGITAVYTAPEPGTD